MPFFDDRGFYKRAQITPNDLALAGVAEFGDLDRLTIFADNLVPHVLRVDGVLRYDARRWRRASTPASCSRRASEEREIRACARARLRADRRRAGRAAAHARHVAVEPRAGAALQGGAAPPHADRLLLAPQPPAGSVAAAAAQRAHLGALRACLPVSSATMLLQLAQPVGQPLDGVGHRVGQVRPVGVRAPRGARPSTRTGWPGLPTTVESAGTSWITTEFAPIFARSPTSIGPSSLAPEPTTTSSPTVGWRLPRWKPVPPSVTPW